MDAGPHPHPFAEQRHLAGAVHQPPPQRAARLEAADDQGAFPARQVVAQVVADASGIAHAAGGDDDGTAAHLVERHGFLHAVHEAHPHAMFVVGQPRQQFEGLRVQKIPMLEGQPGGGAGHGRVHIDIQAVEATVAHQVGQQGENLLGAPHREGGDDDVAAAPVQHLLQHRHQFVLGILQGTVQAVP